MVARLAPAGTGTVRSGKAVSIWVANCRVLITGSHWGTFVTVSFKSSGGVAHAGKTSFGRIEETIGKPVAVVEHIASNLFFLFTMGSISLISIDTSAVVTLATAFPYTFSVLMAVSQNATISIWARGTIQPVTHIASQAFTPVIGSLSVIKTVGTWMAIPCSGTQARLVLFFNANISLDDQR